MAIFSGLSAFVGGLLGGTFLSGIGGALLKIAVGVGLNLLASAISGQPADIRSDFGVTGTIQTGGDIARSFPVGYTATAGSLCYANTWGTEGKTPNAYFTQVIALSDLPISGLAAVWVNGVKVTLDTANATERGSPVTEYRKGGKDYLWVKFYDGKQTAADSFLTTKVSTAENPYAITRVGRGIAYAICTARINEELFTGFPQYRFEVNGIPLYDPSKDSTVGGAGPQRWADPTTWGGDGDHLPAVQLYNVQRGISYNGQWVYGLQGMSAARLPAARWISRINYCRQTVSGKIRYRSGGEIAVSSPVSEANSTILTTCQGRLAEAGGVYTLGIGVDDAPVATITDADILSTEEQTFSPFFGLADTVNGIAATYPSPAEGWNTKAAPPRYSPQFEMEDGNRRLMADVALNFVPYPEQVQRLTLSALKEARRARRHTFVLPPMFWVLEPGDFIRWTSTRNGYETKKFRVDGVVDKANLDIVVDLTEVDPADYDWNPGTDYRTEPEGRLLRNPPTPQSIVDWSASAASIDDPNGVGRRPAIRLAWDGDVDDVQAVAFQIRLAATGVVVYRGRTDVVDVGSILISQSLLPATDYQACGKYIPRSDRETSWSAWLPVKTLNIRLGDGDVYLPGMVEDIQQSLNELHEWLGSGTRDLILQLRKNVLLDIDVDVTNYSDIQRVRQEVTSTAQGVSARATAELLAATGPGSALAQSITALETTVNNPTGGVLATSKALNVLTTRVATAEGNISAVSQNVTALSVVVDGKATITALNALTARVTSTETGMETISQDLTNLGVVVNGKASTTALNALTTRVTTAEGRISAVSQDLTDLGVVVNGKASSTALNALITRVNTAEGNISANSDALTALDSTVGKFSASGKFRVSTEATPAGASARIGLSVSATNGGTTATAALFLDALSDGTSRIVIQAAKFAVVNGSTVQNPFIVSGGVVRMNVAHIGAVTAGTLESQNGKMKIDLNAGTIEIFS